ncbi:phosphoglycerate mutase [Sporothrix schenckii 1099-18]|uniref:Phosphoglycerate mutase n=1 Tax=Sporothrix schenckii 1099-18 TaxID=1397361 RepID=A0A0F2M6L7_SPOSC|nr:phosphoglycerate mutase [Sporothrix schenckii 1099-18]KJR84744.1 phosphoglycerate mutase [Sporothrix schenckii 1099-18]
MPPTLHDPSLSELGFEQCKKLREVLRTTLPGRLDPDLVLVSPMTRTLQTAMASLDWLQANGVPFEAHAGWQETTDHPCDVGSEIDQVAQQFPQVDFSHVDPIFPEKTTPQALLYAYNRQALVTRAQTVLAELYARPEKVVAVVSHSAFLSKAVSGSLYANADFRIFSFKAPVAADSKEARSPEHPDLPPLVYQLHEWDETRNGHGGMGWSEDRIRSIGDELVD